MKYGVIDYSYGAATHDAQNKYYVNVGNDMQSLAVEHLYRRMGIDEEKIVRIGYHELRTYDGDYVILPMNMYGSKDEIFPLSPHIIPLFIGFNYVSGRIADNRQYIKPHEPIGCRDEFTLRVMRDAGIEAYLTGCLTITLPRRWQPSSATRVFMVDTPEELDPHVPAHLKENLEYLTHEIELDRAVQSQDAMDAVRRHARFLLDRYANEAVLVVTSRLHCAAPCMALGIPVIVVKTNSDINMSWLDKFTRIYTVEEFPRIDWQPKPLELEEIKERLLTLFANRLRTVEHSRKDLCDISEFYEKRTKANYNDLLARQLAGNFPRGQRKAFRYAIWGAGAGGTAAYLLIQEKFPDSECVIVVDTFEKGTFFGLPISHPDTLGKTGQEYDFLFVCTYSGREAAEQKTREQGLEYGKDWMFLVSRVVNKRHEAVAALRMQLERPN